MHTCNEVVHSHNNVITLHTFGTYTCIVFIQLWQGYNIIPAAIILY